jgi:uncharacterized OsmC-like protein
MILAIEKGVFKTRIEMIEGYEFRVKFANENIPDLLMDEPTPLGKGENPNAGLLLAAAVGNCLSASLAYCMRKSHAEVRELTAEVFTELDRNEKGRLRVVSMRVELSPVVDDARKLDRCRDIFEDFCIVTQSVRQGFPVEVIVVPPAAPSRSDRAV